MSDKSHLCEIAFVVGAVLFGTVAYFRAAEDVTKDMQTQAIEHGCAHWEIVDQKTGETEFRWIDHEGKERDKP